MASCLSKAACARCRPQAARAPPTPGAPVVEPLVQSVNHFQMPGTGDEQSTCEQAGAQQAKLPCDPLVRLHAHATQAKAEAAIAA